MTTPESTQAAAAKQPARVLIVSDDIKMSAELADVLRAASHDVVEVRSPAFALEVCALQSFQMAIVDESVCQMAGPELARALRDFFVVPTLFLSACGDPEMISTAIEDGSLGYILKPLAPASVLPAIHVALARATELQLKTPRSALRHDVKH